MNKIIERIADWFAQWTSSEDWILDAVALGVAAMALLFLVGHP